MDSQGAYILIDIFSNMDIYMLIFIRFIGLISITPVFGGRSIPVIARVGLALAMAAIVHTSGMITEIQYTDTIIGYTMLIAKEFLVGLIIGYIVFFIFNITFFAGHLIDQQIGFSMSNVFDPVSQTQVPITGNLYYYVICAFFVVTGNHRVVINTFFYSFKAIPMGSALIVGNEKMSSLIVDLITDFFISGVMLAMPIIGTILVIDVALGVLVKATPRMNVFVVGMPLKVFVGLVVVWLVVPMFAQAFGSVFNSVNEYMLSIIKVMMQ